MRSRHMLYAELINFSSTWNPCVHSLWLILHFILSWFRAIHPTRADGDALYSRPALHSRPDQLAQPTPAGQELGIHTGPAFVMAEDELQS
jgi:hypothetical protein